MRAFTLYPSPYWLTLIALALLAAVVAGAVGRALWTKHLARQRRRAPDVWPLTPRAIINSEERKVWRRLELAFVDYCVMVKVPVTRFSTPDSKQQGLYWYELLSSLYCTFTVVRADGQVMGCVDLPSRTGGKSKSQRMKASVLMQCGVPYVVLDTGVQPTIAQLRFLFLGEASAMPQSTQQASAIKAASSTLRSSISRNRQTRPNHTGPSPLESHHSIFGPDSDYAGAPSGGASAHWQDDSFIMPLDSRAAPLKS